MSYVVLARKWRPTCFEDLVGQEHVARTLANAIANGRIAHAFLFTGVRGVGKTTSARLLARSLNCLGPERKDNEPDPGPTATPCLECAACREITAGSDVDVREIDGASYNGVDEVRKLQDSLPYRPTRDRYKIFIIDEVHMLSQSAWNAFLKTLEEPPPHVKFIFATTEVHKVPVTILSRVQRFDFKMIPARLIVERLRTVLKAEKISTDESALSLIAREAAGSMRDAMSLLDQVIAWNDQDLNGEAVARVLGVASRRVLHDLAACVVDGDAARSLALVEEVSQQGFDLAHVAKDFLELLRDLVVAKVCSSSDDLIDLPDEERKDIALLANRSNPDDVMRLYQGFSAGFDDIVRGAHPRSAFEMLLVRLCRRPPLIPLDDLVTRLSGIERRLTGAGGSPPTPMRRTPGAATGGAGPAAASLQSQPQTQPQRARPREEQTAPSRRESPSSDGDGEPAPEPVAPARVDQVATRIAPVSTAPAARTSPAVTATARPNHAAAPSARPEPEKPSREPDPEILMAHWQDLVERVQKVRPEVSAVLEHAILIELSAERLIVAWPPNSVFVSQFEVSLLVELIGHACSERGHPVRDILIAKDDPRAVGRITLASHEMAARTRKYRDDQAKIRNHPRVKEAVEILGARVVSIKLPEHP